ncbi:MAG: motility associated factor glycosyltransferase family protein [Candidatus Gastranaerophilales bacterium]|nr:motility associated factor glycosyltransferase family protein [Candidatus Gastranaerophilales bacterium]
MENKVLEQNIEQIKQYNLNLANDILMFENQKSNLQLAQNENGEYNLLLNEIPLHSTLSAIDEANNITKDFEDTNNSIKIIYGLGLGYLVDSATNKIKNGKLLIYEPNLELIKYVFSIAQIDAFSKNNVFLCTNKKKLNEYITKFANENTKLSISFLNSYKKDIEDIKDVLYQAQRTQGELIGNKNTFLKSAPNCFFQTLCNASEIFKNPNISQLENIYKGKTAIILCAGPSLKENIEIIKQNQDKFVIFALNPTLKILQKEGIEPDFIVAIENKNIISQFENVNINNSYLIVEPFTNHRILKLKKGNLFSYISIDNFFNYWVLDTLKLKTNLKSYGTVSYTAFSSAFLMGFDKIIMVGQDLAFKDGSCYCDGCYWDSLECIFDEKTNEYKIVASDIEKLIKSYCPKTQDKEEAIKKVNEYLNELNKNICTVKGQNGKLLPSKNDYAIFIKCFEEIAYDFKTKKPEIKLINSSLGAQINGFENISLEDIINSLEPIEKLNLDNYEVKSDKEYVISKIDKLLNQLKNYQMLLNDFVIVNEKLLKELTNKNIFTQNATKCIQKHKEILSKIIQLSKQNDINFIINVHLNINEKYFGHNYFENEKITKEILPEINKIFENYNIIMQKNIKNLSDSKSLILE